MNKTRLSGPLGKAIDATVENRFKTMNCSLLTEPFRLRNEDDGAWRCEFWGKIIRSAVTAAYHTGDRELCEILRKSVRDIISTQTADGCISSYPAEKQLSGWDIWGRKYVLLALMRYYEMLDSDPDILNSCCRMADELMSSMKSKGGKITEFGWHDGLAASSILGAFVQLWKLSGDDRYREFALYIIECGGSLCGNIFECILCGVTPAALGNGKAYEMTSCFQGLTDMIMAGGISAKNKEKVLRYYEAVRDREIFITGAGGARDCVGEYWYDGALRQTRSDSGALGETCVITTWIRYCAGILALTDDCTVADEIEKSLYNGILGAIAPDKSHWMHGNPTPLTGGGCKIFPEDQILGCFKVPFGGNDCCRAQGPEGLTMAASLAVTEDEGSITVNLFESLTSGNIVISGEYPAEPSAVITFAAPEKRKVRLRTPDFLQKVLVNGREIPFTAGKYLEAGSQWQCGDKIQLIFDFSLREITAPGDPSYVAVKRGPLVLAADSRGSVPGAVVQTEWRGTKLCDYASAGGLFTPENTLTVWFRRSM